MSENIIGIDIGSSKICAAAGKLDKSGKLKIVGESSVKCTGVKKGLIVDIDDTSECIKKCVTQLEGLIGENIEEAYISFPGVISELIGSKGIIAVSSVDREIKENDIKRVIKAAKDVTVESEKEIVGIIPNQYVIDGHDEIKDPLGMSGLRLELDAQLVVAQSTEVSNMLKSFNQAGIKINGIVFEPMAESEVALKSEEFEMGTALIDIGSDTSNISIFKDGNIVYNDHIPLGGDAITNDIAQCLKVPYSQAEFLKIEYGITGHDAKNNTLIQIKSEFDNAIKVDLNILKQIIEARIEEILLLIDKKMRKSGKYNGVSGIVILGGGISLFERIEELGKNLFEKPFRVAVIPYTESSNHIYASAIGVVQDVSDRLKTKKNGEEVTLKNSKNALLRKNKIKKEIEEDDDDIQEEYNSLMSKIKKFLTEFF